MTIRFQIIECVQKVLAFDRSIEPRRAAVLLVGSLFRGLKTTALDVLRMLELFRILKDIRSNDEDEVMRIQAQVSIDYVNEIMREDFLALKPLMEKRIHVLDYPK